MSLCVVAGFLGVTFVRLPHTWSEIPVKCVSGRTKATSHRAFEEDYVDFSPQHFEKSNPYCSWVFKKNYIKKEHSWDKISSSWRGETNCKFGDVMAHLKIGRKDEINFLGNRARPVITKSQAIK